MFERQNVIAAIAVLVLFGVRSWLRPDPPPSFPAELGRIATTERELLNRYSAAAAQFKAGEIDDVQFADLVERDVARTLRGHPAGDRGLEVAPGRGVGVSCTAPAILRSARRELAATGRSAAGAGPLEAAAARAEMGRGRGGRPESVKAAHRSVAGCRLSIAMRRCACSYLILIVGGGRFFPQPTLVLLRHDPHCGLGVGPESPSNSADE